MPHVHTDIQSDRRSMVVKDHAASEGQSDRQGRTLPWIGNRDQCGGHGGGEM